MKSPTFSIGLVAYLAAFLIAMAPSVVIWWHWHAYWSWWSTAGLWACLGSLVAITAGCVVAEGTAVIVAGLLSYLGASISNHLGG